LEEVEGVEKGGVKSSKRLELKGRGKKFPGTHPPNLSPKLWRPTPPFPLLLPSSLDKITLLKYNF